MGATGSLRKVLDLEGVDKDVTALLVGCYEVVLPDMVKEELRVH